MTEVINNEVNKDAEYGDQDSNQLSNEECAPNKSEIEEDERRSDIIVIYEKWEEYNLKDPLLRGLFAMGFDQPSYIQKTAIMPILSGRDVRAQAQSGSGKTGAFAVAALQKLKQPSDSKFPQVMVVVNTLEMAKQNYDRIRDFGQFMDFRIALLVAGIPVEQNRAEFEVGVDIVVGTPGRIDHMQREGYLNSKDIRLFILDEADELLKPDFAGNIEDIFKRFNREFIQVALFSATWEKESIDMSRNLLENPFIINVRQEELTLRGIDQYYVNVGQRPNSKEDADRHKTMCLERLLTSRSVGQCIVFVSSKKKTNYVYEKIKDSVGFPVALITGDLTPTERNKALKLVRDGTVRVLISTAVTARGIDIQQLSVVINFDLPVLADKSNYIHRIGRAGRYGRKGVAINIIYTDEMAQLENLMNHYHTSIEPMPDQLQF
ncbi:ATP-dependent RNA helicase eIF4A [Cucumispora dikerogammari]|nr:ATP-dependent RNA helicase eIF4A [Cucumispora dikerogammari]